MQKIRQLLITLRSSLWLIPGIMIFISIFLAIGLVEVSSNIKTEWLFKYPRIFGLGADGSRGMLTAIAGSMLTVATLAFSLTLSIIAQASGQYTPRILRNFMRDKVNQFILGYFVSVFAYSLIILRTIRGGDEDPFVPSVAVLFGLILALGGIIVLIFFIHHIATSLQVTNIIKDIEEDTVRIIDNLFPERVGNEAEEFDKERAEELEDITHWYGVDSLLNGYIQFIDSEGLMDFAVEKNLLIRMEYGVGQFVAEGTDLISISKEPDKDWIREINSYYNIFRYRTITQDVGYGIGQIVDIALKALSPGINDTTTALNCMDYLAVIVGRIGERQMPSRIRAENGEIRLFVKSPDFEQFMDTAFEQIRINAKANLAVFLRLLKAYSIIGEKVSDESRIETIEKHLVLTNEFANETLQTQYEKKVFNELYSKQLKKIKYKRVIQ